MILNSLLKLQRESKFEIIRLKIEEDNDFGYAIIEAKGKPDRLDWNEVMGWE